MSNDLTTTGETGSADSGKEPTDKEMNRTADGQPTKPKVTKNTDSDANVYRVDVHTAGIEEERSPYHRQDPGEDALEPETAVKKGDATEANPNRGYLTDEETAWQRDPENAELEAKAHKAAKKRIDAAARVDDRPAKDVAPKPEPEPDAPPKKAPAKKKATAKKKAAKKAS